MALQLGSSAALFRVGSGPPSKVFLGTVSIQNVPGAPVITEASDGSDIEFTPPADGGSPILGYNIYVNDVREIYSPDVPQVPFAAGRLDEAGAEGDDLQIAAVNAIGEGPRSAVFVILN
jgi:hypothetical protein